ncbi:MAG: hypothetical protein ACKV2U_09490 [Bryobacteraceae bacterium]
MPQQPEEQDPPDQKIDRRFIRIEAALETMAKGMASLTTESHSAFGNINATQRHVLDLLKQQDFRFTALAQTAKTIIDVQSLQGKNLETLTGVVTSLAIAQQKTDENVNALAVAFTIAQQKTEENINALAIAQQKTEENMNALTLKSAETQGKLDALIHMWDDWIRDRGGKNGAKNGDPPHE